MNYLTLDFETYYDKEINLKKLTTQAYVMHPQMEVLMVAVKFNDDPVQVIDGEQIPTFFSTVDWSNTAVIAHNAVFDGSILYWRYGVRPAVLIDTMSMAQALGVQTLAGSASLATCIRLLQEAGYAVPPKGTEVLDALGKRRADFTPQQWAAYREYCKNDTDITWFLFKVLRQYLTDEEMRFQDIILRCYTEPRLTVDIPTVEYELNRCRTYKAEQLAEVCKMFNTTQDELSAHLRSNDKFAEVLRSMGGITEEELEQGKTGAFIIPTKVSEKTGKTTWAFGKTDVAFKELCEHEDPKVQAICQARLAAKSSIDETRCLKFLEYGSYGFLPMGYKIGGAHTNRMSGGSAGCFVGETMIVVLPEGAAEDEWEYRMIKDVQLTDLIWDGSDWCAHDGVVCHGVKRVYNWDGLTATKNHECFVNHTRTETMPFKWFRDYGYLLTSASLPAGGIYETMPESNICYADGAKAMVYDILNVGDRRCYVANGKLVHNSANMQNLPSGRREGQSDLLRRSIIARGNDVIINYDASQIECLDGRGMVLTKRGLVELRYVGPDDLLWDGVEWVKHDGVVVKGIKDVITYSGITATPDHVVYTRNGVAVLFGRAAAARIELMVGEVNGKAVYAAPLMRRYKPKPATTPKSPTGRYDEWGNPITGTIEVFDIVNAGPRHRFTYNGLVVSNCRVLAYTANQTDVLGVFASGGDVYSFAASKIHGIPYQEIIDGRKSSDPATAHKYSMMRQYGKTATLALGYGQGAQGFQRYALLNAGINMTMDESARTVRAWRDANGFITGFWRMCDQALATMVAGGQMYFGGPDGKMFFADGNRYIFGRKVAGIRMPNGLWLNYPNLSADFTNPRRPQYFYDKCGYNGKPLKTKVYSGLVAENITQALAFAIMKTQAVWIAQYYPIVMNTHDEWCIVVPREQADVAAEYMHRCMCTAPEYIKGITLASEGGWAQSYGAVDDDWSKRPNNPDRKHIFNPQTGEIL